MLSRGFTVYEVWVSICLMTPLCLIFQLIVATTPEEVSRLDVLWEKGQKNEVPELRMIGADEIREIEPNCRVSINC